MLSLQLQVQKGGCQANSAHDSRLGSTTPSGKSVPTWTSTGCCWLTGGVLVDVQFYPVPWGGGGCQNCYVQDPTMEELTNHTRSAIRFALENPDIVDSDSVVLVGPFLLSAVDAQCFLKKELDEKEINGQGLSRVSCPSSYCGAPFFSILQSAWNENDEGRAACAQASLIPSQALLISSLAYVCSFLSVCSFLLYFQVTSLFFLFLLL